MVLGKESTHLEDGFLIGRLELSSLHDDDEDEDVSSRGQSLLMRGRVLLVLVLSYWHEPSTTMT